MAARPEEGERVTMLEKLSWIFSIIGGVAAFIGIPALLWQRRLAQKLSTSQVLLAVDGALAAYADVHEKLRPGGLWERRGKVHPTDDELGRAEPYMGIFERIFIAVKAAQLKDEIVYELYGYRLANIWNNDRLVETKLQDAERKSRWKHLIALTYVVEAHCGTRLKGHTDGYFPAKLLGKRRAKRVRKRLNENQLGRS